MDLARNNYYIHESQAFAPIRSQVPGSIFGSGLHSSHNHSFPIIAVAIIGILATAFLLVSYYIFVIKCCLSWHRIDLLRRFSFSRGRRREDTMAAYTPAIESRGLDEAVIRLIPVFQYEKGRGKEEVGKRSSSSFCECAVCLNEFQEGEKLRIIPNCGHVFHIDCIDVWLQGNANCPLCRTSISLTAAARFPTSQIIAPNTSPQDPNPYADDFIGRDEDYVVIELAEQPYSDGQSLVPFQERSNSGELSTSAFSISPSPGNQEPNTTTTTTTNNNILQSKKGNKINHISSKGDECIDTRMRGKDDQFAVQPIRRSFSMDSASDRHLYLAVREVLQGNNQAFSFSSFEGCSSRVRRSFFSFGHGKGSSRTAVLPLHLEP